MPVRADEKNNKKSKTEKVETTLEPDHMVLACAPQKPVEAIEEARRHQINHNESRYGIDVSRYQGRINWDEVATDKNVSYAYLKATEAGGLVDKTYAYNLREARRVGVKVGCYHFFSPTASPLDQIKNFTANVDLDVQDLIPIIDVENKGRGNVSAFCKHLETFLKLVENYYGIKPIIYTSSNFYNSYLAGQFTEYKYMIARYKDEVPELKDEIDFVMWQFTSEGTIKGISGAVDRSRFMDGYELRDILLPEEYSK